MTVPRAWMDSQPVNWWSIVVASVALLVFSRPGLAARGKNTLQPLQDGQAVASVLNRIEQYWSPELFQNAFRDAQKRAPSEKEQELCGLIADFFPCRIWGHPEVGFGDCFLREPFKTFPYYGSLADKLNIADVYGDMDGALGLLSCALFELEGKISRIKYEECVKGAAKRLVRKRGN